MADLRVAALVTEYFRGSHADVLVTKILEGYDLYGERTTSRISLASMYLEQADEEDIGVGLADKHGIPISRASAKRSRWVEPASTSTASC